MPSPIDDPDLREPLRHLPPYSGLSSFPSEDDTGHGPEPTVFRPWVVLSIALVSLLMLACAVVLSRMH